MNIKTAGENDNLYDLVQAKKKLPSLNWKQRVIGFGITAGLAALFAILVSPLSSNSSCFPLQLMLLQCLMTSSCFARIA